MQWQSSTRRKKARESTNMFLDQLQSDEEIPRADRNAKKQGQEEEVVRALGQHLSIACAPVWNVVRCCIEPPTCEFLGVQSLCLVTLAQALRKRCWIWCQEDSRQLLSFVRLASVEATLRHRAALNMTSHARENKDDDTHNDRSTIHTANPIVSLTPY
mmetsp:Transcript_89517/g.141291  ORF Transcript_89517/g.141291 Transcript_89517/m.141291 type:complete len:158 (-) Transcript_89517:2-475(-)